MYYKKVNYNSDKECFDFLVKHFEYPILNSWNGTKSIANNVKVYNIPDIDDGEALKALEEDEYTSINLTIRDWEDEHPDYKVGFNGRSGGYLVLYSSYNNCHCLETFDGTPIRYNDYEEWKEDIRREYGSLKNYHNQLLEQVKIVQEFDKLCDHLVIVVKELIKDMKRREENTFEYSATLRFQRFYYDTVEDLKYHMADMKQRGYQVWEYDEDELFAEYEMNEAIHSQVTLEV